MQLSAIWSCLAPTLSCPCLTWCACRLDPLFVLLWKSVHFRHREGCVRAPLRRFSYAVFLWHISCPSSSPWFAHRLFFCSLSPLFVSFFVVSLLLVMNWSWLSTLSVLASSLFCQPCHLCKICSQNSCSLGMSPGIALSAVSEKVSPSCTFTNVPIETPPGHLPLAPSWAEEESSRLIQRASCSDWSDHSGKERSHSLCTDNEVKVGSKRQKPSPMWSILECFCSI